jgi:carbonic anhydrase
MIEMDVGRLGPRLSKRELVVCAAGALLAPRAFAKTAGHAESAAISPEAALKRLMDGNARYVAGRSTHPNASAARRTEVASAQHPFAAIVACADSRVGPELIFDQGLGDLFVARVAGNVVDDAVLGSLEYSVIHLGVPLVVVLGHDRCGAVQATVDALAGKISAEDKATKIVALAGLITPAVQAVPAGAKDKVEAAILLNARRQAKQILTGSSAVSERVKAGKVQVVSGLYGLSDGKVTEVQTAAG